MPVSPPQPAAAPPRRVLPAIVLAQLFGTSPWFTVNAVMPDLRAAYGWPPQALATLSSALQIGFILGTLVFALLAVADRFPARRVFSLSAGAAALSTLAAAAMAEHYTALVAWRVVTGVCLAGIYPVGMKIAAMWFPRGLGGALGWLVGALVVGSASAHALRALATEGLALPWQAVFAAAALLCALAGWAMLALVPEPAHQPRPPATLHFTALTSLWRDAKLRASVFGYFGHMWELYTLWVLVPMIVATRVADSASVSWAAFLVLGAGAVGCIGGGLLVPRVGGARVAAVQLALSALCCLAAPWMLAAPMAIFMAWLLLWGITVAGDSPQFSALTATNAPPAVVGSVLTLTNSLGFALSAVSIEVFVAAAAHQPLATLLPWLAVGPVLGLWALAPLWRAPAPQR